MNNSPVETISILGIDGSGKSSIAKDLATKGGTKYRLMNCPQYHYTEGIPYSGLSEAMQCFTDIADRLNNFPLKGVSLYLQMTLFGVIESYIKRTMTCGSLIVERHAIIDSLVYGILYSRLIENPLKEELIEHVFEELSLIENNYRNQLLEWIDKENIRLGRNIQFRDLPIHLVRMFKETFDHQVETLSSHYRTQLPSVAILIDIPAQKAIERLEMRGGIKELHETIEYLEIIRESYLKILRYLSESQNTLDIYIIEYHLNLPREEISNYIFKEIIEKKSNLSIDQ